MPVSYKKTVVLLEGHCDIEEAENLLEWLLNNPKGKLNLKALEHLHTAVLQVLMALKPNISIWPENKEIAAWLQEIVAEENDANK